MRERESSTAMKLDRRILRLPGVVALVGAVYSAASWAEVKPEAGIGLPRDVSVDGARIDWLMNVTHVFNIILFVIMCAWIAIACFKHNRTHTAEYDLGSSKRSVTIAAIISATIFFVVDGNLFVSTIIDLNNAFWNFEKPANDPRTVRIEINAHQWAWDARYAGPDGKFNTEDDVVTWNDVKVPVGTPVYLQLASTDVIHSFYLPNLRVKSDAVPGQVNRMWFQAKEPGEFDIGCAQHCGTHHYKMKGLLTVLPEDQFKTWLAEASINGKSSFDAEDKDAHWGWEWKEF
jgi:cytochrome c oxidase subunit II